MTDEKPTGDAGASISERLESFLAAGEQTNEVPGKEAAPTEAPAVEAPASDAPEEVEGPQYELSDVAKVLGIDESLLDVAEDGSLSLKTKIDGKEVPAKFNDILASYQKQGHVDQKMRQTAEQEKAIAERATQFENYARAEVQRLAHMANAAQQLLMQEAGQTDWDRLIQDDPILYQQKRHEFERKSSQVQQLLQAANQQQQTFEQQQQQKLRQQLYGEFQRLPSLVPEWADTKVYDAERVEIAKWLQTKGVNQQIIASIPDAALTAVIRSAYLAEKNAPKVAAAEKKVRAAPKLVRPGQGVSANDRQTETVRGLKENIRKSGGKSGVADYLIATGKV